MPSINDLSESKYVTKEDVGSGLLVTITGFERKDVSRESEPESMKYTLTFEECKPLVLNKTNGERIAEIANQVYGVTRDYQDDDEGTKTPANEQFRNWIGKKIVLWNNPEIEFQGKRTGGVRVREPEKDVHGRTEQQAQQYENAAPLTNANPEYVGDNPPPPIDGDAPF